ncbi:MAG TPA: hypothetical protein P5528_16090 [Steroidobacteraceae bacterium]|nr:hypothetical protein [Steroidobacteraceae bacterium]
MSILVLIASACATAEPPADALRAAPADGLRPALVDGKIGAPVDVLYRIEGEVLPNQPVAVQLVLTPRVAGSNLKVEIADRADLALTKETLTLSRSKTTAGTQFRRSLSITPAADKLADLRIFVSIEIEDARYSSYFRVPLTADSTARKSQRKQPLQRKVE